MVEEDDSICYGTAEKSDFNKQLWAIFVNDDTSDNLERSINKVEKCSDNGEPSGTAGKPMLELLKKRRLENILLVVIRYFGGIKLGAGGLVRAYTNSGNLALDSANIIEVVDVKKYRIEVPYDEVNMLKNLISTSDGSITNIVYSEKAIIEFLCDKIDLN